MAEKNWITDIWILLKTGKIYPTAVGVDNNYELHKRVKMTLHIYPGITPTNSIKPYRDELHRLLDKAIDKIG